MGFLKKLLFILLIFIAGCTRSIVIENLLVNRENYAQYGAEPERNFYYPVAIDDSLEQVWVSETSGSFNSTSPVIYDKYLFMADLSGKVYCFDIETGKTIGAEKSKGAVNNAPVVYRTRLFFIVNDYKEPTSTLFYYDFLTGEYLSENKIPGRISNEMLKTYDGVYVLSDRGTLYKFNYIGQKEWEIETKTLTISSPIIKDQIIFWANSNGEIVSVNLNEQKILYRKKITENIEASIGIKNNYGFVGDTKGKFYKFNLENGKPVWEINTGSKIINIPVFSQTSIFIGNLAGDVFCLDISNGKKIWNTNTGGVINAAPLLFENYLVQPDLNRKLHLIDAAAGNIKRSIEFESRVRTSPVFYRGMLFFGVDKDKVYAYRVFNK